MENKDYGAMRADLMRMTMRQVREIAKREGICLGYAGSRKSTAVDEIVGQRQYRERHREVDVPCD